MVNKKITDLTELTSLATGDYLVVIDVSDVTDASSGTTKKLLDSNLKKELVYDTSPQLGGTLDNNGYGIVVEDDDTSLLDNGIKITSSQSAPGGSVNLLYIETTDTSWDRPLIRTFSNSAEGGAADIRIDSPNPDIEFVETDQVAPAGKYELAVQGDAFQINGRNAANNSFENFIEFQRIGKNPANIMSIKQTSSSATVNWLRFINTLSSSGARPGLTWRNEAGSVDNVRLSASSGASHIDAKFYIQIADSSKVLQDTYIFDNVGNLSANTVTGTMIVANVTTTERDAMTAINGMIVYNTTTTVFNFYENGSWVTK